MPMSFSIAPRFSGPPDCANGGYAAGLIAHRIGEPVAVRLHKPVPLDTAITLVVTCDGAWEARAGELTVASARRSELSAPVLADVPSFDEACSFAEQHRTDTNLRFDGCFVCGPARAVGDGLRIFSGRVPARELVVAPFRPDRSLADAHGSLPAEVVWAALDCPGYFSSFSDGKYALLGELAARIERPLAADEDYVVAGWPIASEGRKRKAGTALFDRHGEQLASASAIWIEVAR